MTFPFKPGPPPGPPQGQQQQPPRPYAEPAAPAERQIVERQIVERQIVEATGHPAVDAALRSLANASRLAPGEQIAAYEAAHQVLQETLSSIEG